MVESVWNGYRRIDFEFNGREALMEYYRLENAPVKVWYKPDCDHHPHGLDDTSEIIEYIKTAALK